MLKFRRGGTEARRPLVVVVLLVQRPSWREVWRVNATEALERRVLKHSVSLCLRGFHGWLA